MENTGDISKELQDRLNLAPVCSNMVSTAYLALFNWKPTKGEFKEMAKSLAVVYLCLIDCVNKSVNEIVKLLCQSDFIANIHTFWPLISIIVSINLPQRSKVRI